MTAALCRRIAPYDERLATPKHPRNIVDYPRPPDFIANTHYLGAVIGPVSGHISPARYRHIARSRTRAAHTPTRYPHEGRERSTTETGTCWTATPASGRLCPELRSPIADNGYSYGGTLDLAAELSRKGSAHCVELSPTRDGDTLLNLTLHQGR